MTILGKPLPHLLRKEIVKLGDCDLKCLHFGTNLYMRMEVFIHY